jgi:hypothetical protein
MLLTLRKTTWWSAHNAMLRYMYIYRKHLNCFQFGETVFGLKPPCDAEISIFSHCWCSEQCGCMKIWDCQINCPIEARVEELLVAPGFGWTQNFFRKLSHYESKWILLTSRAESMWGTFWGRLSLVQNKNDVAVKTTHVKSRWLCRVTGKSVLLLQDYVNCLT